MAFQMLRTSVVSTGTLAPPFWLEMCIRDSFGTAGGALIGGCAVFNNRFCIVSTAGVAAAAAVGACKAFGDLRNARVFVHLSLIHI